jgi:hypothetical protein
MKTVPDETRRTIDVCTTATLRPEILNQTYASFSEHLLARAPFDYRLILNIDCIGDDVPPEAVCDVAAQYFPRHVIRFAEEPSFDRAFAWCWDQVEAPYFFWLEDDWIMMHDLDLARMVELLETEHDLALLRLNFFGTRNDEWCRQWQKHVPWNGRYFELTEEQKTCIAFSGHPSLIRREWSKIMRQQLVPGWCPEKCLSGHFPDSLELLKPWRYGIFQVPFSPPTLKDIGRPWREAKKWYKHRGYSFTHWVPESEAASMKEMP